MTKYREIIRLTGFGSYINVTSWCCGVAQKTVVKVQKRARELNLSWPLDESMTDTELQRLMFAKESLVSKKNACLTTTTSIQELLHQRAVKASVDGYMEDCRANGDEPPCITVLPSSSRMNRNDALLHVHQSTNPVSRLRVDWAGDPATIIDPDTGEISKVYIFVGVMTYSQYAYVEAFLDMKAEIMV